MVYTVTQEHKSIKGTAHAADATITVRREMCISAACADDMYILDNSDGTDAAEVYRIAYITDITGGGYVCLSLASRPRFPILETGSMGFRTGEQTWEIHAF